MHELSIVASVVDTVTESLAAHKGARVIEVRLRVGRWRAWWWIRWSSVGDCDEGTALEGRSWW